MRKGILPYVAILVAGSMSVAPQNSVAQASQSTRYTLVLRGVPLGRALEKLAYTARIDLVYTSEEVEGKVSYCNGRDLPPPKLLTCILAGSGLDYVKSSSGAYVLIESISEKPLVGHLAGSIVDSESGEPLPYATVLLADARSGTSTNSAGSFSFASVLTGPQRLVVTYVGYETATDSVWIEPGATARVRIPLKAAETTLAPIVVDGLTQRLPSAGLGGDDRTGEALRSSSYIGTTEIARGLAAVPGVAIQQPWADLHIQGGATGEHVTLLDGVPVRDPVSLGRHLSAFSPLALGRVTIRKAGFGASHGSHLSGLVEAEHDLTGLGRGTVTASVDPVSLNARAEGGVQLPGGVGATFMAAARTSVWNTFRDPAVTQLLESWHALDPVAASTWVGKNVTEASLPVASHHGLDIAFSDLHSAIRLQLSPFRTLYASAYRARNQLKADFAAVHREPSGYDDRLLLTRDEYDWTNWVGQVRHSWILGARAALSTQVQGSWNDARYAYFGLYRATEPISDRGELLRAAAANDESLAANPATDELNHIRELAWRNEFSYSLSPRSHFEASLAASHISSQFAFGNPFVAPIAHESGTWQVYGFVEGRHSLGLRTVIEPGLRWTYVGSRNTLYAEPRLAIRHDATSDYLGSVAMRFAGGLYRQFVNQFDVTSAGATTLVPMTLFWLPLDASLAPPRAFHLSGELLLMPDPAWTISAEIFQKWQHRILMLDYAALAELVPSFTPNPPAERSGAVQSDFVAAGAGRAFGGSIDVKWDGGFLDPGATYAYTHARRRYPGRFDDEMQPVPWNAPHRLTATLQADVNDGLQAVAHWTGEWGRRWPLRQTYYDYVSFNQTADGFAPFDLQNPAGSTLPPYYRLDAGLTYHLEWRDVGVEMRMFVTNVFNRRNTYDRSLQQAPAGTESLARLLPGRHIFASIRLTY